MTGRQLDAVINYAARAGFRQRYFANDHSRDTVVIDPRAMPVSDCRAHPPTLEEEGSGRSCRPLSHRDRHAAARRDWRR
jgi:hypothetical protein